MNELQRWGLHYTHIPSQEDASQPGWALRAGAGRQAALPAGQTCELRVGPEIFYLGSDAGKFTVRRGPAPGGDAVVTMSADTLYGLLCRQMTVPGAVRPTTVHCDTEIAPRSPAPRSASR